MISLEELKKKAIKNYPLYLEKLLTHDTAKLFPLVIPSNKGKASDDIFKRATEFKQLHNNSKNNGKSSYTYETEDINTRHNGIQTVLTKIFFETDEDFLSFIGKKEAVKTFISSFNMVEQYIYDDITFDKLLNWAIKHNDQLSDKQKDKTYWKNIAICAKWLYENPDSNMYIRMIPLEVHSKFIENNVSIIQNLLNDERNISLANFIRRNNLKDKPSFFRLRLLDKSLSFSNDFNPSDIYITESDFQNLISVSFMNDIRNIFIVENEMIYLTFPEKKNSLVLWGHGFTASYLASFLWLKDYNLYYFGDLDEHGFEILSIFRKSFPNTKSICMDMKTFKEFNAFRVKGEVLSKNYIPEFITDEEKKVFVELRKNPLLNRLEQERISQKWITDAIANIN